MRGETADPHSGEGDALPPFPAIHLAVTENLPEYTLLDSGHGRKLERFGRVTVDRPEPQALWSPRLEATLWQGADGFFESAGDGEKGRWRLQGAPPESWPMVIDGLPMTCRFGSFCHLGIFPEQYPHWQWMIRRIRGLGGQKPRLLNLFGHTGVASVLAAAAGAEVTHVEASRQAIAWARLNQSSAGLEKAPIRWILEDARAFAAREARRGRTYHGLMLDPPKFGRGPGGEVWHLFQDLPDLLRTSERLLEPGEAFLILTTYAVRASCLSFDALVREILAGRGGHCESGELVVREAQGGRALSTSLFTRWESHG